MVDYVLKTSELLLDEEMTKICEKLYKEDRSAQFRSTTLRSAFESTKGRSTQCGPCRVRKLGLQGG